MTNYTNTYVYACRIITTTQYRRVTQFSRKIYFSLYLKGLCVRGSWRPNRTATYWPHSYGHQRYFPVLLGCSTGGLGAQPLWDMFLNPASSLQLVWSPNWLIGGLRAPSAGCWLSLLHLVSNWSDLQTDYSGAWGLPLLGVSFLYRILSPIRMIPNSQSKAWGLPLLGAGFLYRILSPTDWISCALSYIIVQRPPSSWRHKLHSFNPSTVKVILCYSSTGCTCYLHRCIFLFWQQ